MLFNLDHVNDYFLIRMFGLSPPVFPTTSFLHAYCAR